MIEHVVSRLEKELAECAEIPASKVKLLLLPKRTEVFLIFKEKVSYTKIIRNKIEDISNELYEYDWFLTDVLNNPEVVKWVLLNILYKIIKMC